MCCDMICQSRDTHSATSNGAPRGDVTFFRLTYREPSFKIMVV